MAVTALDRSTPFNFRPRLDRLAVHALLAITLLACGGCVVGRRNIDLEVPTAAKLVDGSKGSVSIVSVVDQRKFENKPDDPSTPSIDGDVTTMTAADQAKMIGRQRNGYGKAMGDIALANEQTVDGEMRLLLTEAFKRRGYSVTDAPSNNKAEVVIDKFWAWFTPGFWSVDFEANVSANMKVSLNGRSSQFTVEGHGKNSGQVASDANWKEAYSRAFDDFLNKLDAVLASLEENVGLTQLN